MPDLESVLGAVADAQRQGALREREVTHTLSGEELRGKTLRWVELDDPAVVYFPDAHLRLSARNGLLTGLLVAAFLAGVAAIISITESDLRFTAIFLVVGIGAIVGAVALGRSSPDEDDDVDTDGLYLLPDCLIHIDRDAQTIADRSQVIRFGCHNVANASADRAKYREFVEISVDGKPRIVTLQGGILPQQRDRFEAWRAGTWPIPLPR